MHVFKHSKHVAKLLSNRCVVQCAFPLTEYQVLLLGTIAN